MGVRRWVRGKQRVTYSLGGRGTMKCWEWRGVGMGEHNEERATKKNTCTNLLLIYIWKNESVKFCIFADTLNFAQEKKNEERKTGVTDGSATHQSHPNFNELSLSHEIRTSRPSQSPPPYIVPSLFPQNHRNTQLIICISYGKKWMRSQPSLLPASLRLYPLITK